MYVFILFFYKINIDYFYCLLQMVTAEDGAPTTAADQSAGTFGKLRQTLSSSLLTAQDRGKGI